MSTPQKPAISVVFSSLLFLAGGVSLVYGLIDALRQFGLNSEYYKIFGIYILLSVACFLVAYGIFAHKRWAYVVAVLIAIYFLVNFLLGVSRFSPLDTLVLGIPIIAFIFIVIFLLYKKKHHFKN